MKQKNYEEGKVGENIAKDFLQKKGYKLVDANFRLRGGEIDLIFTKDGKLIFAEVKLKVGQRFGSPEEMIDKRKIYQVQKIAQLYLLQNKEVSKKFDSYRIDAVCIVLNEDKSVDRITHYENITG